MLGKVEGDDTDHHGHVTALTVAPEYRRLKLASSLMDRLEASSASPSHDGYFVGPLISWLSPPRPSRFRRLTRPPVHSLSCPQVDLFVRCNNALAIAMYEGMGYSVYRRVEGYYNGMGGGKDGEDAFDMRKALPKDVDRRSVRPDGRLHRCKPEDVWF